MHRLREPTVLNAFANVRGKVKEGREINLSVRLNRSLAIVSLCCRSARKDTSERVRSFRNVPFVRTSRKWKSRIQIEYFGEEENRHSKELRLNHVGNLGKEAAEASSR